MKSITNFEVELSNFDILSTGADGGHRYLSSEIHFYGNFRRIDIFFESKTDEAKLDKSKSYKVGGKLIVQGINQPLMLNDAKIIQ